MRAALSDPPILALMVAQTLIWAATFYVFPALVIEWRAEFGWSAGQVMGALSLALAVQGLAAGRAGDLIDRGLAPVSMPGGALLGAGCLALLTQVDALWQFYALWGVIGLGMSLTLYDAAFALVVRGRDETARQAITAITLVAGFASTIAYPLTAWVSGGAGWRAAVWVLVALVVLVNMPLAAFAARRLEREGAAREDATGAPPAQAAWRRPGFWPLTLGLGFSALAVGIVTSHLLPLFAALGVASATAVLAASIVGPSQVAGRVALSLAGLRVPGRILAVGALAGMGLAATLLLGAGAWPALVLTFAVLHGMCVGLVSILRPVVIRETLGPRGFGAVQGAVVRPALFAFAAAPFVAALVADAAGYLPVIALCIAAQAGGAALLWRLPRA
ncbi:MFS transporter [Roseibacterium sp. SDUM158017]|uniref:MFS transporter n=1 Tax=Roseicyclus salinarum TaxID=3036773 RepID=UPI002414E76B|nr:MFS transporter [Roseibacterium sp. SDUM158017]MDG4649539.1 MFS transporter [Roseibacterium sp. SDUM158017]